MAKTAPLEGTAQAGSAPGPSYAGAVRATGFQARSSSGAWQELHTVTFKPTDHHLPQGQKGGNGLRTHIVKALEVRGIGCTIECVQILSDKTVKVVFSDATASQLFFDRGLVLNGINIELNLPVRPTSRVIAQDLPFHMPASIVRQLFYPSER